MGDTQNSGANRSLADDDTFAGETVSTGCGKQLQVRSRGPGKGRRAESVHLLTIAIQALQNAREGLLKVNADMPKHERDRLLIGPLSDVGLAVRSAAEALERLEAGKL